MWVPRPPEWVDKGQNHRAEYATVAGFRLQKLSATSAVVKELAGISRHCLRFRHTAIRASNDRFQDLP